MPRRKIPMSERQHGLVTTYKAGCRCDDCTKVASDYAKERYHARKAGDVRRAGGRQHGTRAMYKTGCRCEACTKSQSDYNAERRKAEQAARPVLPTLDEIRIPASCLNCGAKFVQQTESAVTGSGRRMTVMLRCSSCGRQEQFIGTLVSMSGAEYMGAA